MYFGKFQDVKMDKFRCAKLVLDSLHFFNDVVMNRMSVAICSILGKFFSYIFFNKICIAILKTLKYLNCKNVVQNDTLCIIHYVNVFKNLKMQ